MNYMVYPINIPLNHYKNPIEIVPNKNHTITTHAIVHFSTKISI